MGRVRDLERVAKGSGTVENLFIRTTSDFRRF